MSYIPISDQDKKEMLARIGVESVEDLFCCIPESIRLKGLLNLPGPLSEPEILEYFEERGKKNSFDRYLSFLGGGAYDHFIPAVVDYLSSRGEFVSPYTPYQPEVSQGTLQVIFEFQTLICQLTGLDIANASLYDGATGAAEAVLMANRVKNKKRLLVASNVHPEYRQVIYTYTRNLGLEVVEIPYDRLGRVDQKGLESALNSHTSVLLCQSPNYFGVVEDLKSLGELTHRHDALLAVVISEPLSLGLLEAPGKLGADIVTGEAQSFGLPLSYGGPYLGFMACKKEFVRQLPGRIAGQTVDAEGRRGFVLTLSTREQHIRREKATSNICTNQAHCALRATIYLETLGRQGLKKLAWLNLQKAAYALEKLTSIPGVSRKFGGPVFNEFVLEFPTDWNRIKQKLEEKGILGGLALGDDYQGLEKCALVTITEKHSREKIDRYAEVLREVLK
ncbi:MAG: Glycine dehydrogenase [decarboxylating] (glycine cleavage system P1 protein) [Candidatus Saccharicenans subterraneus]|uniref:Probable glycine dehydrogenase (decarboxylating) subunit 1 n=1 Tax=Candidatus Saccharicenans subterraneus TaxID=2508984 RepID=A0A3E2BJG1_9BACT|nr:MAG: Glycine dehydrogenase [decarboxylating] (glycine cleavage system P1 protein) [Candidatus Saccharicenans subterraneum]